MRIRHLLSDSALRSSWVWPPFWNISYAHYSGLSQTGTEHLRESQAKHVSLYDELFSKGNEQTPTTPIETSNQEIEIPRLPLPSLGQFDTFSHRSDTSQQPVTKAAEASTQGSVRQWEPAVLTLSHASKSLVDSDFRRIMPKGRHIQELAGGGEIMRVIPGRDPSTFQQRNHYFLLFPNPACARMYQKHVTKLHILARSHTPASLGSRLPPTEGTIIGGQDAHTFLQDYALYPPSQRITTTSMATPFSNTVKPLIEHQGHPQLTAPTDRTGRSVLFWVDACSPSTRAIRSFIDHDSRDRGLPWAIEGGSGSIERLDLSQASSEDPESTEQVDSEVKRRSAARWIVSFVDENEARRFVRAWRRRPFPSSGESAGGEDTPLVNAEFLW